MNKYHAKKVEIDGIKFDSIIESNYYRELKIRLKVKDIIRFDRQVEYELQPGYQLVGSKKKARSIKYKADFVVYYRDGSFEVIDIKGSKRTITPEFKLKKKMFEYKYRTQLHIISSEHGKWIEL